MVSNLKILIYSIICGFFIFALIHYATASSVGTTSISKGKVVYAPPITTVSSNTTSNSSLWWAGLLGYNTTQFENIADKLTIKQQLYLNNLIIRNSINFSNFVLYDKAGWLRNENTGASIFDLFNRNQSITNGNYIGLIQFTFLDSNGGEVQGDTMSSTLWTNQADNETTIFKISTLGNGTIRSAVQYYDSRAMGTDTYIMNLGDDSEYSSHYLIRGASGKGLYIMNAITGQNVSLGTDAQIEQIILNGNNGNIELMNDTNVYGKINATNLIGEGSRITNITKDNPFNQSLNNTDNVVFNNINANGNLSAVGDVCTDGICLGDKHSLIIDAKFRPQDIVDTNLTLDSSVYKHNGRVVNATINESISGYTFTNGRYIDYGNSTQFNLASNFSISIWGRTTNTGSLQVLVNRLDSTGNNGWQLRKLNLSDTEFRISSPSPTVGTYRTAWDTNWNHLVMVYNGVNITGYWNGVQVGSTAKTGLVTYTATKNLQVGVFSDLNTTQNFQGEIDDFQLYNRTLTSQEVSLMYNEGKYQKYTVSPPLNNSFSIGSNLLRWMKTWTIDLDVSNFLQAKNVNISDNLNIAGNLSVKRPHASFSSTETQTIGSASTPFRINYTNIEDSYLVNITTDNSNITFQQDGVYLITISAIFSTDLPNKHAELWIRKNNIDVARSNTHIEMATSSIESILSVPLSLHLNTTDKLTLWIASDDAGTQMIATGATAYSPASPSIIINVDKQSELH